VAFCIGDRVDVVLKDSYDRFVMVEVEVDCTEVEIVGPLQCMKYRAMMAYLFGRQTNEIRTILVAHSIHSTVIERCRNHAIECCVVDRVSYSKSLDA
jgi:hypothetical protein